IYLLRNARRQQPVEVLLAEAGVARDFARGAGGRSHADGWAKRRGQKHYREDSRWSDSTECWKRDRWGVRHRDRNNRGATIARLFAATPEFSSPAHLLRSVAILRAAPRSSFGSMRCDARGNRPE